MRRAAPEREAVRANEPEGARSGRLNRPEDSHELGHSPEVEGGVMVAAALREVSHGFEEIGRDWVWEMDAAMRHLDHGVGEEGVKRRLRFPGRSRRQGPQYHCDVERSDASTVRGWRRADYAQPAFARMVVLGVLVWLGDLGEIEVDRSAKGEDVRLSLSLQAGPASAGWSLPSSMVRRASLAF
jgi:hypothetical protein